MTAGRAEMDVFLHNTSERLEKLALVTRLVNERALCLELAYGYDRLRKRLALRAVAEAA